MNQTSMPTYEEIEQALAKTTLKLHPSEIHGILCGILSGNPKKSVPWEELVTGGENATKIHDLLQSLFTETKKELSEFLFEFQLLLPSDDGELAIRAEALTLWCQGFLAGLKAADVQIMGRKPSDTTEAINDIVEIAKMNYEDVVASEEDEAAYIELVEYVRMAAILVYQNMHGRMEIQDTSGMTH